ncbi:MAG: hypothetical protein ACRCZW_13745 [Lactobacillaceae bacterium]
MRNGNSSDHTQYSLIISEKFYASYHQEETDANQGFSSSIKNKRDITLEEGLNLLKK